MHVGLCQPFHGGIELGHDVVVVEEIAGHRQCRGSNLIARYLVTAAIDRIEQRLCQIDAGAEELHLLAEAHRRDAAGDPVIVTPERPHQVVVLVLQRGRVAADLDAIALEGGRHMVRPENRDVRLGGGAEIGKRVQHPIAALGHQRAAIQIHSADAFGGPVGVAAEQRIVVGRAEEPDDAELLHQLVPKFLRPRLVQNAGLEVALDVDVQEGRDAPDRHRRAVGFLDRAEIGEVRPLECFLRIRSGLRYVETVEFCHRGEVLESTHLLRQFLAQPDDFVGRPHIVDLRAFLALGLKQPIHAVKRHAPVIADDATASVGIRKPGDDPGPSAIHDFGRIRIEHAVIVRFSVFRESFVHERIGFESRGLDACLDHPQSAVGENRPLERLVRLKAYDDFIFAIDIAGLVGEQRRRGLNINREHSLLSLVGEVRLQFCPNGFCALRWAREKVLIPRVRLDVPDDEIPNVDGILPVPRAKAVPAISAANFLS